MPYNQAYDSANRVRSSLLVLTVSVFILMLQYPAFADGADEDPQLFGMVVTGKRPGPPLWKISNQGNVLWVFGTLDYLPKRLRWDPASVRFILSESEEYISPPRVSSFERNPFKAISLMRTLSRIQKLPDGKTLQDVLPEELYVRFLEVKSIYAPRDNKLLNLRPATAASQLFSAARDAVGLSFDRQVSSRLRRIARGQGASMISHEDNSLDPKILFQGYENILMDAEITCMESTLETIETDLQAMIVRANAWADGDAELLLELDYPNRREVCVESIFDSEELRIIIEQTHAQWVKSVESALINNKISFANFPMREIAHPEGLLAQLRQQGYIVSGQ